MKTPLDPNAGTTLLAVQLLNGMPYRDVMRFTMGYDWPFQFRAKAILALHPKQLMSLPIQSGESDAVERLIQINAPDHVRTIEDKVNIVYSMRVFKFMKTADGLYKRWMLGDIDGFKDLAPPFRVFFQLTATETWEETLARKQAEIDERRLEGQKVLDEIERLKQEYGVS